MSKEARNSGERGELPLAVETLEHLRAAVLELDLGRARKCACELGYEDLVSAGRRHDAGGLVHCDAAHVIADELDLAHVHPGSNVEIGCVGASPDRRRAVERPGGAVECGDDAVARRRHLAPLEAVELVASHDEVLGQELAPTRVSQAAGHLRGVDEVGEEQGA